MLHLSAGAVIWCCVYRLTRAASGAVQTSLQLLHTEGTMRECGSMRHCSFYYDIVIGGLKCKDEHQYSAHVQRLCADVQYWCDSMRIELCH